MPRQIEGFAQASGKAELLKVLIQRLTVLSRRAEQAVSFDLTDN